MFSSDSISSTEASKYEQRRGATVTSSSDKSPAEDYSRQQFELSSWFTDDMNPKHKFSAEFLCV